MKKSFLDVVERYYLIVWLLAILFCAAVWLGIIWGVTALFAGGFWRL